MIREKGLFKQWLKNKKQPVWGCFIIHLEKGRKRKKSRRFIANIG
jgi:hypothetical protein